MVHTFPNTGNIQLLNTKENFPVSSYINILVLFTLLPVLNVETVMKNHSVEKSYPVEKGM